MEHGQLLLRSLLLHLLDLLSLFYQVLLDLALHVGVEQVEALDCSALLRREVKVVIAVVLVGPLALFGQLAVTFFATWAHYMLNVLLHAWTRVESDVHDVERCFTVLLGEALSTPLLRLCHI